MKKLLPKNHFFRSAGVLVGGTAGGQLIMVLSAPLLSRLYSPEQFGLLAVYISILSLFAVIASLRYELAIPLAESAAEAANVAVLSFFCVLCVTVIAAIIVMFMRQEISEQLAMPELANYFWLLPLSVLVLGGYQVFNYWAVREKKFDTIARSKIVQAISILSVQFIGYRAGGVMLLVGQASGQGAGTISLASNILKGSALKQCSRQGILKAAYRYRQLPLFSTWAGFFNAAGQQLPALMLAAFFSASSVGQYALAQRVLMLPMSVIGTAIGQVFFGNAAEAHREGRLGPLVRKIYDQLSSVAMPAALLLVLAGPQIFLFVFGDDWEQAGVFARWMAPWLYMVFITSPLSTLLSVLEKERLGMFLQAFLLAARAFAIAIGAWVGDVQTAVILFSIVSALYWLLFLLWIMQSTHNSCFLLAKLELKRLALSLLCLMPLWYGLSASSTSFSLYSGVALSVLMLAAYYIIYFLKAYRS